MSNKSNTISKPRVRSLESYPPQNAPQRLLEAVAGGRRPGERAVDARRRGAKRLGSGLLAGALALSAGLAINTGSPEASPAPKERSISYLNNDEMEAGIVVQEGDTPMGIAQVVNGNRLKGQALIDAAKFIQEQGSIVVEGPDGEEDHYLYAGDKQHPSDVIEAPLMSDQQIKDVNSGKVG